MKKIEQEWSLEKTRNIWRSRKSSKEKWRLRRVMRRDLQKKIGEKEKREGKGTKCWHRCMFNFTLKASVDRAHNWAAKILHFYQSYHIVLEKGENLKYHPIDFCTIIIMGTIIKYNCHWYLDSEFWLFFIHGDQN